MCVCYGVIIVALVFAVGVASGLGAHFRSRLPVGGHCYGGVGLGGEGLTLDLVGRV
jgi:hypothetical protein